MDYPALRYLLTSPSRLFPEERAELISLIGRVERLARMCACDTDVGVLCTYHAEIYRATQGAKHDDKAASK